MKVLNTDGRKLNIVGSNIIDQLRSNEQYRDAKLKLYDINKTGFKVTSKIEILKIERKIKHFNVYKNNHVDRRLESKLTVEEMVGWAAFYKIRNEEQEKAQDRTQRRSVIPKSR